MNQSQSCFQLHARAVCDKHPMSRLGAAGVSSAQFAIRAIVRRVRGMQLSMQRLAVSRRMVVALAHILT
jgi:hypothetical protein